MFQLTLQELDGIRFQVDGLEKTMSSQIVMTFQMKRSLNARSYAFTEQGVAMLSSKLKTKKP